jgi:peptidoglycan/xylan/chitin deacetylase (PgdA/CDA1 family)
MSAADIAGYERFLERGAVTIYLLHGVIRAPSTGVRNYTVKHLHRDRFRALCQALSAAGRPVGVDEAVALLRGEEPLDEPAFLLSFDDGFHNNLAVAAPIMDELGIPGVFYVTTGFVEDNAASWIDLIEDAVEKTGRPRLPLPWSGEDMPTATREERIALLDEVRRVVKQRDDLDPYAVAESMRAASGAGAFEPHPELDRKLTWAEVRDLASGEGFTVGGHSHTHRILTHLDREALVWEVDTSLALLSGALGEPVRHYSYPEGLAHCYSDEVIAVLRERGVICSPTAEPGTNRPGADLFRLRRIAVV